MVYYDPRKPKPWPIKLLNTLGIKNDSTATQVAIAVALLGILLTVVSYLNMFTSNDKLEGIPPEEQFLLEQAKKSDR